MKISKLQWTVHAIIAFLYSVSMFLLWNPDGNPQFWFFFASTWIMIVNSLFICNHIEKTKDNNSSPMDYSLFAVLAFFYGVIIVLTVKGPELTHYNESLYLVLHLVVLGISAIIQLLMLKARKSNIVQEKEILVSRVSKDDLTRIWTKIASASSEDADVTLLAKKIENEIRYSDPIIPAQLADLEKEIFEKSDKLLQKINGNDVNTKLVLEAENEILELVKERNDKAKMLK